MARAVKTVRIVAWIVGGLLALLVLGIALLHTPPARKYALKRAVEILDKQGVRFNASGFNYNLAELELTLESVEVRSPQAPDLPPLLLADRVNVDLSLRSLIKGDYSLEDATIRNPRLHLVIDENGRDNIPRPPEKQDQTKSDAKYFADRLLIEGGSIRLEDRRQQLAADLPIQKLLVDGNPVTGNHDVTLDAGSGGSVSYQNRALTLSDVKASVLVEENAADIKQLTASLGDSTIALTGRVNNFTESTLDIKADTNLALASLVKFAGVQQTLAGNIHIALAATGTVPQLKATARLNGDNLTVDRIRDLDLKAEGTYDAAASRARLESLNATSPVGNVQGQADLALKPQAGQSTANLSARGLNLAVITSTLKLPIRIASRADAKVSANWPALEFEKAAGDATLRLAATRQAPAREVIPVSGAVDIKSSGNRTLINIPGLRTLDASMQGRVVLVNRQTLSGNVQLRAADLAPTIRSAEAFLGRKPGTLVGTPVAGELNVTAALGGTVKEPTANTTVAAPALAVGDLKGVSVEAAARYNPRQLTLEQANIGWQGQALTAAGTVGLKGTNPPISLTASAQTLDIATVLAGLNRTDIPASGQISLDAKVAGTTKAPSADVHITGRNLAAYNEQFGALDAQAALRNDTLELQQLRLDKPQEGGNGSLQASGTYNLKAKDYAFNAQTDNFKLTALTLPNGDPVRGTLDFKGQGQGNVDNPAANVELAATGLQVADQQIGDAKLTASVANRQADINAAVPKFNLTADARIGTAKPYAATFEVKADGTNLETLPLNQPVKGTVTATVRGKADLDNYEAGQAAAEVSDLNVEWNGQPLRTEGPLVARYENKRLIIDQATLIARDSRVALTGTLPLEPAAGEGEVKLSAKLDLPTFTQYIPAQQPITAQGTATIDGTIRGTLKRIDPNITIGLADGYFSTPDLAYAISKATLNAQVANGALNLQSASANYGPASLAASGTVPFALLPANLPIELPRAQGPAQFTAELRDLDLGSVEGTPDNLEGRLSARLEATAPRPELEAITGTLTFPQLRVSLDTFGLEQKGVSEIRLANGTAQIASFNLTGPETELSLSGTAGLVGARPLNLKLDGKTDIAILSAFAEDVRAEGDSTIQLAVSGTMQEPQAQGFLQLAGAQLSMRDPRVAAENLNLRVDVNGTRATISQLKGQLNGGELSGGGTIEYAKGQFVNTNLNLKANDVYLDFPVDLKTVSDLNITVANGPNRTLVIGGDVVIEEGGYTEDLHLGTGLLGSLGGPREIDFTEERNPIVESIRFNVGVRTQNPIIIDNNYAEAEITADLRVLGTPYEPGLSGRLEILEGGELRLQERAYTVDRGVITFTNDRRIEPTLDILATTRADVYDITLQITGEPGNTETTLTSDPDLPEPDILALLLTGKTMEEMRGQEFDVARNQVLSYLAGSVGSRIGSGLAGATGLSTVRIEPNLIAAEDDPSARLTVGQNITRSLELIYSMNLINSSDQIYIAEYDVTRRFTTRGTRQADGSFRFDLRHDLRFGGTPAPRRTDKREDRRIGNISIVGNNYFTPMKIEDKFGLESGDRYDFFKARKGVDKVDKMYEKANRLESRVRLHREEREQNVDLTLAIKPGPEVDFVFEGASLSGDTRKQVRQIWRDGVFDAQRAEEAVQAIRASLVKDDYLQPKIEHTITKPTEDRKRVVFDIQTGPKFANVKIAFDGTRGLDQDTLRDIIDDQKLQQDVYTNPSRVTDLLTRYYRENGYLDAEVEQPRYELDAQTRTGSVVFPVQEGPLYRVANVRFEGNSAFNNARLNEAAPMPIGEPYRPVLRENAIERLRQVYWEQGYNDVEFEYGLTRNKSEGTVDVAFKINENRQAIVYDIVIEGRDITSDNLVRTQLELKPGDILDLQKLAQSRRNLYNTGAYSLVEITRDEITDDNVQVRSRVSDTAAANRPQKPVRLNVRIREVQPYELRYGGFFDTERGPGGIVDIANRNSLGSARVLGLRARYDNQLREGRVYFSQPELRRFPFKTIASPFIRQERNPESEDIDPFNVDRVGFSIQQETNFRKHYLFNYGYKLERSRTYDPLSEDDLFDIRLRIASLTSTFSRETRDELLDATRGSFFSHAVQFSPEVLGSQVRFLKYFGQYFKYFPLQKPRVELFTNEVHRPRLVYATGVRLGLAKGFGNQEVPLSERFLGGGSNSVRGFEQNSLGPRLGRDPLGGEGILIINNELRFPLFSIFDGVSFVDIGNVYEKVSDFSFGDIRKAAGLGLRVRTPWFLLRLDYGMKLDRQPGESRGRVFFSIGQAF